MDLRRQLSILRHWAWRIAAAVVLAGGAAFLVSGIVPKTYEATTTLIVGQSLSAVSPDYNELLTSQRLSQTYAQVATTRPILQHVIDETGIAVGPDELAGRIEAEAPQDSTLIRIVVSDRDPVQAAAIADAVAEQLIAASPAIQGRQSGVADFIDRDLTAIQDQIRSTQELVNELSSLETRTAEQQRELENAQNQLITLRSTYATLVSFSSSSSSNLLSVVEPAVPPGEPSSPRVLLNTVLGAFVGLMLAIGLAFAREYLDDSLKSAEDVESVVGLPALGAIARMRGEGKRNEIYRLTTLLYPRSPISEAYRTLRTNIEFAGVDQRLRVMLVTSSVPGEGKTTTAGNLAVVFAQAGRRTLLVDADMRKPAVHQLFNLPNGTGLSNLFRSDTTDLPPLVHATEQERLWVMTSGPLPPNPAELLSSERFKAILGRLREEYDLVIIDSAPLQAVTDPAILSSLVDGTLFVIDSGRTRRGAVLRGRDALAKSGAHILGVVMNRLSTRAQGDYYLYDSYYHSYGADAPDGPAEKAGKTRSNRRTIAPAGSKRT